MAEHRESDEGRAAGSEARKEGRSAEQARPGWRLPERRSRRFPWWPRSWPSLAPKLSGKASELQDSAGDAAKSRLKDTAKDIAPDSPGELLAAGR